MGSLVIMKNRQAVTSSLQVAEGFNKQHKDVLEAVDNKIQSAENSAHYKKMFAEGDYRDSRGRLQRMYFMNRDGFSFIAFGFTGKKADEFKLKYIQAFNDMEQHIKDQQQLHISKLSPELQIAQQLLNATSNLEIKQQELEDRVKSLEDVKVSATVATSSIKDIVPERLYTSSEIAEQFGYRGPAGVYVFHKKLHELKIIYPKKWGTRKTNWRLYKKYRNKGYKDLSSLEKAQLWTAEGKRFLEEVMGKEVK